MKKNRLIFYAFFALFHLFIFLFSLYMDNKKNDVQFLFTMQKNIGLLKYGSFIGLILLATDIVWLIRDDKKNAKDKAQLDNEMTSLKAKLFDLQEDAKKRNTPGTPQ